MALAIAEVPETTSALVAALQDVDPVPAAAPPPCVGCRHPVVAYRPGPGVYIVNQGPEYSGPKFFVTFKTYTPTTGLAAPSQFPYISARHVYRPPLDVLAS